MLFEGVCGGLWGGCCAGSTYAWRLWQPSCRRGLQAACMQMPRAASAPAPRNADRSNLSPCAPNVHASRCPPPHQGPTAPRPNCL
eukprot:154025-Chlamydomonas_euryale.AAC.1